MHVKAGRPANDRAKDCGRRTKGRTVRLPVPLPNRAQAETMTAGPLPLRLDGSPLALRLGMALAASWLVAAGAWVEVPLWPVPMTMQSLAVLLAGALLGWRLGLLALLLYLAQGAAGLPLFAGGRAGLDVLTGPTAGYLAAFPLAAALMGLLAERRRTVTAWRLFAAFLAGHLLILALGALWLAGIVGPERALAGGVLPFLTGAALKSALGAATVLALDRWRAARAQ